MNKHYLNYENYNAENYDVEINDYIPEKKINVIVEPYPTRDRSSSKINIQTNLAKNITKNIAKDSAFFRKTFYFLSLINLFLFYFLHKSYGSIYILSVLFFINILIFYGLYSIKKKII
jgi:hypothetical protein